MTSLEKYEIFQEKNLINPDKNKNLTPEVNLATLSLLFEKIINDF